MELKVIDDKGQAKSSLAASDDLFGRVYNEALVHQVVTAFMANARSGDRAQKGRSEIHRGAGPQLPVAAARGPPHKARVPRPGPLQVRADRTHLDDCLGRWPCRGNRCFMCCPPPKQKWRWPPQ